MNVTTSDFRRLCAIAAVALAGCGDAESAGTSDEADLTQNAIAEGSPKALGVLQLVNTASTSLLDLDAALTSTAAKAIVAHRQGPDGADGTADDDPFGTIAELDATPNVGPSTLAALVAYAESEGYVKADPFDPASCTGAPITHAQALAHFAPGATTAALEAPEVHARSRACSKTTGCGAWATSSKLPYLTTSPPSIGGYLSLAADYASAADFTVSPSGMLALRFGAQEHPIPQGGWRPGFGAKITLPGEPETAGNHSRAAKCTDPLCTDTSVAWGTVSYILGGDTLITDHCFRFDGTRKASSESSDTYTEYEVVVSSSY